MDLERLAFSYEICKIAQEKSKRKKGYGAQMLAAAPVAVASSAADFPKGWVDKKVETVVSKGLKKARSTSAWKTGLGRSAGRLSGSLITTPLFYSGIKDLKEGRKREGAAKVLVAGGIYSTIKGGVEAGIKNRGKKLSGEQIKKIVSRVAGTRGVIGLGSAALTASSIANAQRKSKGSTSFKDRVLIPATIGAAIGAPKGAIEDVAVRGVKKTIKGLKGPGAGKVLRSIGGAAAGRSASGVIGAVAISEAARFLSGKTKKASADQPFVNAPTAGQIYSNTRSTAQDKPDQVLQRFLRQHQNPESTPTRRAMTYAVNDELRSRGVSVPRERVRDRTHPPMVKGTSIAHTAAVAAVIAAPSLVWELGISKMKASEKDMVLRDALDQMAAERGIQIIEAGSDGLPNFDGNREAFYQEFDPKTRGEAADEIVKRHAGRSSKARNKAQNMADQLRAGNTKFISAARDSDVSNMAHELGHATAGKLRRKTIAHPNSRVAMEIARIPAIVLPLLALDSASDKSFHTKEEIEAKARFAERVGGVSLLLGAPELAEEATASVQGLRYMKRLGASDKQLARAAARLAPAWATYAAPFATGAIVSKVLRNRAEKKSREGTSQTR